MSRAVHLTLDILERLVQDGEPMRLTEFASGLEQPKATVYRALATLEERGYIARLPDERYRLGVRCLELGASTGDMLDLRAVARENIEKLSAETEESVHLAVYERGEVVYVDKVDSMLPVAPKSRVGTRAPATSIATGRALLAFQSAAEIDRVLSEPAVAYTQNTMTDPDELRAMLEQVRRDDLARNDGSWRDGVSGIAAPVRDHTGVVVASIGCCMPSMRLTESRRGPVSRAVLDAAANVSRELGYRVPGKEGAWSDGLGKP